MGVSDGWGWVGMGGHHPQPHLAWPVLAGRTTGDTVRLQVHVPKGHLLPLDAELAHAACGRTEVGVWGGDDAQPPTPSQVPPQTPSLTHEATTEPRLSQGTEIGVPPQVQLLVQIQPLKLPLQAHSSEHHLQHPDPHPIHIRTHPLLKYLGGPINRGVPIQCQRTPGEVAEEADSVVLAQPQRRRVPNGGHARTSIKPYILGAQWVWEGAGTHLPPLALLPSQPTPGSHLNSGRPPTKPKEMKSAPLVFLCPL